MKKKTKKLLVGIGMALGIILLSCILMRTPLLDNFEKKLTHGLYRERPLTDEIVIIALDDKTISRPEDGGLGVFSSWSPEYYSTVINELRQAGAHSIFLDVLFPSEQESVSFYDIAKLSLNNDSTEKLGESILSLLKTGLPSEKTFAESLSSDVFLFKITSSDGYLEGDHLVAPGENKSIAIYSDNANSAFADVIPDENEQVAYALPLGFEINGEFEESLSLKIARDYLYRGEDVGGHFSMDGKSYNFDKNKEIPNVKGQFLVNYAAKSRSYPYISFVDIYRENYDPSDIEGKIVLIGPTSVLFHDVVFTPIDEDIAMPGIEIQANAIQTVLDGAFLNYQTRPQVFLMIATMVLLSVFTFLYLPVLAGSGVFVVELIAFPLFARWMFAKGIILDLIWPVFALVTAYLAVLAYRNFTEFKEKREIKNAFSHYVSADLVKEIAANPKMLRLGGERREITTMFLDLENFTSLSESLQPQQVVQIINVYFDAFANVIMEHGGTVDKFEGDAIMAMFGAPVPSGNHAVNACTAALSLRKKLTELNKSTGQNLNLRIGIATGQCVVGNMGSKSRFDYTAMGDTVNTASRLEGGNKFYGTRILV
ncbi:MAG: adenylate/guanylate cyclase domain-containing protein, partial [Chloroflexota bacterium]